MQADEFQSLVDSIGSIGVQNPITLLDGMVIDGWHRYQAATSLGMDCPTVDLDDTDPRDFVMAQNKARRHITQAQLVACASAVYRWMPHGGNQTALSAVRSTSKDVAEKTGASVRTVEQYRQVERKAAPEVIEAVKRGEVGLPKAAAIAKLPMDQQAAALHKPAPKPVVQEDDGAPDEAEFNSVAAAEKAEAMAMRLLLASDEPLADVTEKYKQSLLQIEQLSARIVGLQNQSTQQVKTIKALQTKLKKLELAA
jgi:ParB-like chromosome segregation protein Spo0J